MSDQSKYRTENRSLGSSYINLAKRFDKIPQSLILDMKIFMKWYHLCDRLMIKNGLSSHVKILRKSYDKTCCKMIRDYDFVRFSSDQIWSYKIRMQDLVWSHVTIIRPGQDYDFLYDISSDQTLSYKIPTYTRPCIKILCTSVRPENSWKIIHTTYCIRILYDRIWSDENLAKIIVLDRLTSSLIIRFLQDSRKIFRWFQRPIFYHQLLTQMISFHKNFHGRNEASWNMIKSCGKIGVRRSKTTIFCTIFRLISHYHARFQHIQDLASRSYVRVFALG